MKMQLQAIKRLKVLCVFRLGLFLDELFPMNFVRKRNVIMINLHTNATRVMDRRSRT